MTPFEHHAHLPGGFRAAGLHIGIKHSGLPDLALIVSDTAATAAGTFTTNPVHAAPVKLCRQRLAGGCARAIVINSGIANACTGEAGLRDAEQTAAWTAEALGIDAGEVLVCSTGHIGERLPMPLLEAGLPRAVEALDAAGGPEAGRGIMTTDTVPKAASRDLDLGGRPVRITGLAKGAGMIEPNMATMLCFVMTDAAVDREVLQATLAAAVGETFNRISVDGDRSTNDTVLALANGHAGGAPLTADHPDRPAFARALTEVLHDLAMAIVDDGEGAAKRITLVVEGARDDAQADTAARAVAHSFLVKTSWAGARANWGRVLAAVGYSGVEVDETLLAVDYNDLPAVRNGVWAGGDHEALNRVVAEGGFTLWVDLGLGSGQAVLYTCECTEEYVRINVE